MRKLASIRRIDKLVPHKNADRLEVAILGGWPAVVAKGEFAEGELVIFCEVDCLLPPRQEYQYLEKSCSHTEPDGTKWYRIKTVRLRGQLSQGLVLPLTLLRTLIPIPVTKEWWDIATALLSQEFPIDGCEVPLEMLEGSEVTEHLGIRKYEKPLAPNLAGVARGSFPSFIPKTDEERIQNLDTEPFYGLLFHRSEKLDGSSCTVYRRGQDEPGVCSRNLDLVCDMTNTFWRAALASNALVAACAISDIAIQGEVCGPGIQGNRYELPTHKFFAFNVFDIAKGVYLTKQAFLDFCEIHKIPTVPILKVKQCPYDRQEILADAEGPSLLNPAVEREGVVWTAQKLDSERFSFKAISNKFLEE